MRPWCALAIAAGCASAPAAIERAPAHVAATTPHVRGRIIGRALLDGAPVRAFGVAVIDSFAMPTHVTPGQVRAADGRFEVPLATPAFVDVVISGPGFARRDITKLQVDRDATLDLGAIELSHGNTIDGHVTNESGTPVPDAEVELVYLVPVDGGELERRANGDYITVTDRDGYYRIDGVANLKTARISAGIEGSFATLWQPERITGSATIDLVARPVGQIAAQCSPGRTPYLNARSINGHAFTVVGGEKDGSVLARDIPAGDYDVIVGRRQQRATVVAGETTTVPCVE
jgi:hypothetical protein